MLTELKERLSATLMPTTDHGTRRKGSAKLRNLVCVMPDMIEQVRAWASRPEIPTMVRRLYGILLSYVYAPLDLCCDDENGLAGYLDDAYFTATVYKCCMVRIGIEEACADPRVRDMAVQIPGWLKAVRKVLPRETAKLDAMLEVYLAGDSAAFINLLAEAEAKQGRRAVPTEMKFAVSKRVTQL